MEDSLQSMMMMLVMVMGRLLTLEVMMVKMIMMTIDHVDPFLLQDDAPGSHVEWKIW